MEIEICSNTGVEVKDPRFQALKGKLNDPKMTDYDLGVCLQCYRERFGRDIDWLPSVQDEIDSVIWYIKNVETQEKPVGMTHDVLYEKYTTIRKVYTPSQYNDVIDLLSRSFSKRVDSLFDKSDKSKTRQQLIKEYGDDKANGFERIMQAVFKSYEKLLDVDTRMQKFLEKYPNVSDAQKTAQREFFETQAREFKKILDYKGILAAAAAARIGENEGFVVSYDKLDVEFERFEEPEENTPEAEEAQTEDGDKEQDTKGDRYIDYRTVKLMETIAPEAKRFIRGVKKVDSAGRPITNFMGMYTYLNPAQTGVVLKRIISNSSPKSMMQDLRNEADRYPWLRGLITELEKNTDMQTLIYVNFKGAEHVYVYSNREKGHYEQHIANSKAAGNAFVKEAGINMSGFVLSEDSSVYTEFGIIKQKDEIAAIKAKFEDIKGRILSPIGLRYVKMVSGDKPYSKGTLDSVRSFGDANAHDSSHLDYEGAEAMEKFLENNPDILPAVTDALRGLGFDVVEEDVKNAVTQMMSEKSLAYIVGRGKAKSVSTGRNKLYQLVTAIDGLYNAAVKLSDSGKPATGQYFFNTTDGFRTIANCLSSSKYLETEERVVQGNKSLTTHTHVNLLTQVTDDLTNKENKSEEEYQADLERDYLRFEGMSLGYADQRRSVGWLDRFQRNVGGMRDNFRIVDDSGFNGVEYSRLTDVQKMANSIIKYFGLGKLFWASDYAGVEVNIQADYENAYNFALVPKMKVGVLFDESTGRYAPDSELVDALVDEVAIEIERINAIKERSGNKNRAIPKVYEEQGLLFQIFPGFNTNGFLEKLNGIENTADRDAFIRESIVLELSKVLDQDYAAIEKSGVLKNNLLYNVTGFSDAHLYAKDGRVSSLSEKAQEMLRDYCLNVFYARLQICKIYTGGLHQFNGIIDYEKRNMLLHAPHSSLYTEATYKGKRVLPEGKDYQTALYINDDTAKSEFFDRIEQSLKELHKRKIITKQQYDAFCEKYKYIKTTDGVGLRTLDSYREMILISDPTSWSDEHEAAYKRIKDGHPKASDIKLFMQGQKLVYSGPEVVAAAEGTLQKPVKLTVLHKYSEEVLLPVELANYCLKMKSAPLKGLAQAVKDLGKDKPDLIIFGSGVKTGSHSVIDPYEKEGKKPDGARLRPDADSIAKYIVEQVKARPYAIHRLPFKYLGISSSTKPHVSNEKISIAAQAEDMMWSNIKSGDKISVRGQNKEATWGRDKYFEIKTAEIIENYQSLCKLFANNYELSKMLREELATKSYVSSELYSAISLLEDGTFAMPFYSPNMEHQIQALFSSVIKKRLIKPKGKGANIIQGTGFGMDFDASKFDNANAISEDDKLGFVFDKKTGNFKYVEVTVPLTDTRLLRFADEDGSISAEKLRQLIKDGIIPESMLEFIAYRTPSDAEHSIIPCRIKAFTANVEGATIRMPKEVMVLTGNDFDGDKMRCHFKNFRIIDIEQDTSDENLIDVIFRKKKIKTAWTQKAETVEFDYDKSASEQSSEARYNARVELMFSEATSPEGFLRMIIPGGNDETTTLAKTHYLIKQVHSGDEKKNLLKKGLVDLGISESKAAEIVNNNVSLYETLTKMNDVELSSIIKTVTGAETPFSLAHSLDAFNYIVRNSGMIGTYATMNAAYRKLQRLNMRYVPRNDAEVTIFGHTFGKLFDLENRGKDLSDSEKEKIIGGLLGVMPISRLLNAAVDNGKNPILGYINQTKELAPFTLFLTAAGLTEEDIDLIFNQPAVLALTERIRSAATEGSRDAVSDVIDSLVDELSRNLPSGDVQFGVASKNGTFKSLEKIAGYDKIDFISMLGRSLKEMTDHIEQGYEDVIMQISVLQFLKHLNAPANNLMTLVRLLRPDSDSGTFSSSVASMICKKAELDAFRELLDKEEDQYIGFSGARGIMAKRPVLQGMKSDRIAAATKSELPEITSLISLMIEGGLEIVSPYFPQARASWTPIIEKIANMYDYSKMQEGVLKRIGRDAILFKLLSDKQFIPGDVQEEQKKILYGYKNGTEEVKSVPERLGALRKRIAEATAESDPAAFALKGNIFIDNLYFVSPEHSVDGSLRLQFRLSNAAIEDSTDTVRASWGEMLNINDEEIQALATDLFMYNFYTSGLNYGMYEFSHLVPFSVLMKIPGYLDALNRVLESDWTDEEMERFKQQYQMNHWFEEKLVPNFKSELFDITWDTENKGTLHIVASQKNKLGRFRGKEFAVISFKDYNKYIPYFYSVSRRYVEGEDGKKHLAEIILTPAQMLGYSNYHKQISLSYNPALSASLITRPAPDRVILSDEDLKRAHTAEANIDDMENMQDSAPAPTEAPTYIPPSTGLTAEEDRDLSVKRTTAIASAITDEARSLERLAEVSEGADDSNFDNTEGVPVQEPSSPNDEGLNEVDIQITMNTFGISREMAIAMILKKKNKKKDSSNAVPTSSISTTGYRKGDPKKHPDTAFVFTENAEAYTFTQGLMSDTYVFPNPNNPKINVSDANGTNQAGIRTDAQGNLTPNAFGIIVKKYQQDVNGRFVAKEGQFQDTDEDFKMFKTLNEHMFNKLEQSGLKNIVFPSQMALGKAALPKKFVEWLKQELFNRFGVSSTIEENTTSGYEGYGLRINSIIDKFRASDKKLYSISKSMLSQEMQTIKEQAIADGTFMKAPNGNPTNLNERQWLQVRTKAFKDWFGDWENDPENASKVVDENGEPLVVYSGRTKEDDGVFKSRLEGFYFTKSAKLGQAYAESAKRKDSTKESIVYETFLNIRNPKYFNENDLVTINGKLKYAYGPWQMLWDKEDVKALFGESDGGFMDGGREIIVFNPNQIKSAEGNNGEFSEDPDIYLSVARRDEDGKIVKEDVPATPENVLEARKQRAYVKLNRLLREILRKKGISVGVLSDAEARMSLSGIADFDTARVTAEGLIELIRIAKGMEGEYALPEEFAHVALEMLGYDNPLVNRLLTALSGNQKALEEAFGDQYEEYSERYENDRDKLVIEAAGKLVAKALLRNEPVQTSGIRRLIDRIVAAIKELLSKFNIFEIRDAISESEDVASQIAKDILSGRLVDYMQVENITSSTAFAKIHKDITEKNDIINKIIKTELKRLNILKKRLADKKKSFSQRSVIFTENQIAKLRRAIVQHKEEAAIADYLATSVEFIRTSQKNLEEGINKGIGTNRICKRLVVLRDTLDSFSAVIDAVNKAIADKEIPDSQNLKESIGLLSSEIGKVYTDTDFIGKAFFQETLADVYGKDGLTISIGKEKGRHVSIKEMSEQSDGDVSFMGRWFHSMADVGDYALRAISELVRSAKRRARLRSDAIRPVIEQAIKDLIKETGSADQSFMFHYKRWNMKEDGREDDGKLHKSGRYLNEKEAEKLSPAQRKFYDTIMSIKKELDKNLPASLVSPLKIVMLRKYSYERYRDAHGLKEKFSTFCEGLKNSILETSDDVDYENKEVAVTFSGNKLDALVPKFTLKGKNETYDDMTDDIATSIMTYANMATEYNEMNDIIGILENARYMSSKRDVVMRTGSKKMRESIGDPEKDDLYYTKPFTVKQAHTRLQEVMDDFFKMHVYNRLHEDEGTFGRTKISKRKLAGFIERMVSLSQMALNLPQRVANVNTGATMIAVESVGKGKFNAKDVWWATRQWMKYSVDRLAETGKTDIANKLSLFNAYHDILQQNGRDIPNYQRGRLSRIFSSNLLYAGLTIGEDFLASTTALAVARNFKVKNQKTGKAGNLFDAYDVKYRDEANKSGAYLALNPDYTKPDGSPITKEDEEAYAKEVIALNFEMQGIYNLDDRSAIQQYALGSMLIMYRKWIAPALKRRYQGLFNNRTSYSIMKGEFEEGYYSTLFHFLTAEGTKDAGYEKISEEQSEEVVHNIINDIKALMVGVSVNWNKLTDYEKANVHKAITELAIVFGLFASALLLTKLPPDDHDGNKVLCWADDFVLSNILRLRTELGAQAPTPMFVGEGLKILNSPFAALGPLRDSLKIFQLAIPSNYVTEVKSGRYRGHSKAYKYFRELPIISMFKKIDNFVDPSSIIQYYENEAF